MLRSIISLGASKCCYFSFIVSSSLITQETFVEEFHFSNSLVILRKSVYGKDNFQ